MVMRFNYQIYIRKELVSHYWTSFRNDPELCIRMRLGPVNVSQYHSFHSSCRSYGNRYTKSSKSFKQKGTASTNKTENSRLIQARPPGEKIYQSKFDLPDKNREQEISRLQVHVQELHREGQYSKALEAAETLLDETKQHFSKNNENHPATAAAYNNVGLMCKLLGRFDDSRKQYLAALKIYKAIVGTDHASYASILHNLGNLNRSQVHVDTSLRATDRLSLIESAVDYLEEAYSIRKKELGDDHPHTVATRSSWGATLSTQILHHYRLTTLAKSDETTEGDLAKKRFYLSLLPDTVAIPAWAAAEEHLREALQIAIDNPRGLSILDSKQKPPNQGKKSSLASKNRAIQDDNKMPIENQPSKDDNRQTKNSNICTLSAAAAAQNLAILLKCRATTLSDTLTSEDEKSDIDTKLVSEDDKKSLTSPNMKAVFLTEARGLFEQIMNVQSQLLPGTHPDHYTTKYSYAELLDTLGDEEGANAIRKEIVDAYDPPNSERSETNIVSTDFNTAMNESKNSG